MAKQLALSSGFHDRASFSVGDGADTNLPKADIVILDRVVCCYPEMNRLVKNSLDACISSYTLSVPRDDGVWWYFIKLAMWLKRVYLNLKQCQAYTYLHSTASMKRLIEDEGFREVLRDTVGPWLIWIFARDGVTLRQSS